MISDEVTVSGSLPRLFSMSYIKKDKHKVQPAIPVMSRIAVNGTITQFSVPPHLWKAKGDRAKGKSLEADRINRHLDNIRIRTVVMAISGLNRVSVLFLFLELVQSACPTSRRSAVQIRLFPPNTSHSVRVACFVGVRETAR